jgi:hypothetical protein
MRRIRDFGLLEALLAALRSQKIPSAEDALLAYGSIASVSEVGVGERTVAPKGDDVLEEREVLDAGLQGLTAAIYEYSGRMELLVRNPAVLPRRWRSEFVRDLVATRDLLGRAIVAIGERVQSGDMARQRARCEGLRGALAVADERAYQTAVDLLPIALEVREGVEVPGKSATQTPWWDGLDAPWWADVLRWSRDGMTDDELAETWLIPALARAAARREGEAEEESSP